MESLGNLDQAINISVGATGLEYFDHLEERIGSALSSIARFNEEMANGNITREAGVAGIRKETQEIFASAKAIDNLTEATKKLKEAEREQARDKAAADALARQSSAGLYADAKAAIAAKLALEKQASAANIARANADTAAALAEANRQTREEIAEWKAKIAAKKALDAQASAANIAEARKNESEQASIIRQAMADSTREIKQGLSEREAAERAVAAAVASLDRQRSAALIGELNKQEASVLNYVTTAKSSYEGMHSAIEAGVGRVQAAGQRYDDSLKSRKQAIIEYKAAQAALTSAIPAQIAAEAAATASMTAYEAAVQHANLEIKRHGPLSSEATVATAAVARASATATADMNALAAANSALGSTYTRLTALQGIAGGATAAMGQKMQGLGRALMFSAQGLEDLQYGFFATVNNIPLVVNEVGKLVGLTPGISMMWGSFASLAGIAINQVVKHWDEWMGKVDEGKTNIEVLTKKVETLSGKKVKFAVDRVELSAAEADLKRMVAAAERYNRVRGFRSVEEVDSQAEVDKVITKAGGEKVTKALKHSIENEMLAKDPAILGAKDDISKSEADIARLESIQIKSRDERKELTAAYLKLTNAKKVFGEAEYNITHEDADEKNAGAAQRAAGSLLLPGDPGKASGKQEELAKALDKAGLGDVARSVRASSPAEMEARKQRAKDAESESKIKEETKKAKDLQEKEDEAKAKELAGDMAEWFKERSAKKLPINAEIVKAKLENAKETSDPATVERVMKLMEVAYKKTLGKKTLGPDGLTIEDAESEIATEIDQKEEVKDRNKEALGVKLAGETPVQRALRIGDEKAKAAKKAHDAAIAHAAHVAGGDRQDLEGEQFDAILGEAAQGQSKKAGTLSIEKANATAGFKMAASKMRASIKAATPRNARDAGRQTAAEKERLAEMKDQLEFLKQRIKSPFMSRSDVEKNQIEMRARAMDRSGATIVDPKTNEERAMTPAESREVAAAQVRKARADLKAKMINEGIVLPEEKAAAPKAKAVKKSPADIAAIKERDKAAMAKRAEALATARLNAAAVKEAFKAAAPQRAAEAARAAERAKARDAASRAAAAKARVDKAAFDKAAPARAAAAAANAAAAKAALDKSTAERKAANDAAAAKAAADLKAVQATQGKTVDAMQAVTGKVGAVEATAKDIDRRLKSIEAQNKPSRPPTQQLPRR